MLGLNRPKVVVVTGASAGVGRAAVRAFAKQGAHVGLIARGRAGLEGALREVESVGSKGMIFQADVSDPDQVEQATAAIEEELGPIDVWVNNAFCSVFSPVSEMTPADYKRVTEVTYLGFVYGTLAALKRMRSRDRGMIVQVGSALAYRSIPLQSAYCAAKHAIAGFTDSLRCELIHDNSNVRVTMVQMPALNTPQFTWSKSRMHRKAQPVPPIYQPEVAADAIVYAAGHYRREWFVGGSTAVTIVGNKMAPGLGDWYLGRNGYESQQRPEREDPSRPNNLYEPVDEHEDYGAHGPFDDQALDNSRELWVDQHRDWVVLAGLAGGVCDAVRNGASKFWRGGLLGLALGGLGLVALSARGASRQSKNALAQQPNAAWQPDASSRHAATADGLAQ